MFFDFIPLIKILFHTSDYLISRLIPIHISRVCRFWGFTPVIRDMASRCRRCIFRAFPFVPEATPRVLRRCRLLSQKSEFPAARRQPRRLPHPDFRPEFLRRGARRPADLLEATPPREVSPRVPARELVPEQGTSFRRSLRLRPQAVIGRLRRRPS